MSWGFDLLSTDFMTMMGPTNPSSSQGRQKSDRATLVIEARKFSAQKILFLQSFAMTLYVNEPHNPQ